MRLKDLKDTLPWSFESWFCQNNWQSSPMTCLWAVKVGWFCRQILKDMASWAFPMWSCRVRWCCIFLNYPVSVYPDPPLLVFAHLSSCFCLWPFHYRFLQKCREIRYKDTSVLRRFFFGLLNALLGKRLCCNLEHSFLAGNFSHRQEWCCRLQIQRMPSGDYCLGIPWENIPVNRSRGYYKRCHETACLLFWGKYGKIIYVNLNKGEFLWILNFGINRKMYH